MYKVGILERPDKEDEQFSSLENAEVVAITNSMDDGVWGVWNVEDGSLVSIAYQSQIYSQ